eukprot:CAMPEP_0201491694 /NCGR_PEP_ID=MMETSP0151_2-20130828/30830_1 /ASSEMBLY_ACC=CAM_ASM_000257 /TAXON_ID=200890 /ORGANISM="Paramoeba atlantica, Strain 621/1 / CCAP 1560/9" /LENGTH=143 /DNA_ID=CAMNT_0047878169 /DNA_START=131 /DNA_END=562 /DNA_ORIENTATION=-
METSASQNRKRLRQDNFDDFRARENPKPFEQFIAIVLGDEQTNVCLSDDFSLALRRARDWVAANNGLREKSVPLDSFLRSLKQICQFKRSVPASCVVESLIKKGLVSVSPANQALSYRMEALAAANLKCHYVVQEVSDVLVSV